MLEDEYGPPTPEDDAWFTHAVASLGYPKVKRNPEPIAGQLTIGEVITQAGYAPDLTIERRPDGIYINGRRFS